MFLVYKITLVVYNSPQHIRHTFRPHLQDVDSTLRRTMPRFQPQSYENFPIWQNFSSLNFRQKADFATIRPTTLRGAPLHIRTYYINRRANYRNRHSPAKINFKFANYRKRSYICNAQLSHHKKLNDCSSANYPPPFRRSNVVNGSEFPATYNPGTHFSYAYRPPWP